MDFKALRDRMVTEQLIPRGIRTERVLEAFRKVERHKFLPQKLRIVSYADNPLPIGEGQTISQPYMVAIMTEKLNLKGNEKVLEIGTGSGYQAAILAELSKEVYTVERFETLLDRARDTLGSLGYDNIETKVADGTFGWQEYAPYDAIIVTAGAPHIPKMLLSQLKDSGRLVIPVGGNLNQLLTVVQKKKNKLITEGVCGCVFVPLVGEEGWEK